MTSPVPADPPGSDELREAVRRIIDLAQNEERYLDSERRITALIRSREADLERRVLEREAADVQRLIDLWAERLSRAVDDETEIRLKAARVAGGTIRDNLSRRARAAAVDPEGAKCAKHDRPLSVCQDEHIRRGRRDEHIEDCLSPEQEQGNG